MKTWILILVIIVGVISFVASFIHLIKEAKKKNTETKKLIGLAFDVAYLPVACVGAYNMGPYNVNRIKI